MNANRNAGVAGGSLFTQYFLEDGIRRTPAYESLAAADVAGIQAKMARRWRQFAAMPSPSEAETEAEFIFPTLEQLGWAWLVQPRADARRRDVADALLFLDAAAKERALRLQPAARLGHGAVIVENEARATRLDRALSGSEAPATQILRYMSRAEVHSGGSLRWGLLTNGATWRLYYGRGRSRSEDFVGIDLAALLNSPLAPVDPPPGAPRDHWMRVFLLLFRREALEPDGPGGRTFLDEAMDEGRTYKARVTEELSERVFDKVFPALVRAFARSEKPDLASAAWRAEAREGAIRLLYRLLFLFYAEDRDLLPVRHPGYAGYSLRGLRQEAARIRDDGQPVSSTATGRWARLMDLMAAIADGETTLGLPAYNGDLFRNRDGDILGRVRLTDQEMLQVVEDMSREASPDGPRWINYRDLSVQHLGTIYERLLEHDVVQDGLGGIALRPSPYARKASGSFYTREELVQLILRQAVAPLVAECNAAASDPADAILGLRICDPAMGSGHFLVSLIDYLTDAILTAMADADEARRSPLAARIVEVRQQILDNAERQGWAVLQTGLDDRHIVRRMVLKRCIFGVDLNPMAVELAKLSLWLHSFTVGAPLSFLDHHLRCGDSLFGEFVGKVLTRLQEQYGRLVVSPAVASAQAAAAGMAGIEARSDADLTEVYASRDEFIQVEAQTAPLRAFLDLYHASRWLPPKDDTDRLGRSFLFDGSYGDPVAIANGARMKPTAGSAVIRKPTAAKPGITAADAFEAARAFIEAARPLVAQGRFLHWEAAFPGVWQGWESAAPQGGFHAVIGNPPWDRIKMQEVEWWAARREEVAAITRAADRKTAIARLRRAGDTLAVDYDRAASRAESAAEVAAFLPTQKHGGKIGPYPMYPLFARGDVNLYALFVERAGQLVRADGIVGLLVPSGVAADKGAAEFFSSISGTGRLGALLDFENRRPDYSLPPFFPAVDSRFKFSALVHGGVARFYPQAQCAFFQQDAEAAERDAFAITPAEFAQANPNTGTAPVFRSPRDARLVLGIYARLPVLLDRRATPPRPLYPVAYARQFDMTNDSRLFRTADELEADGAYPVADGAWEKGNTRFLPLMVGRSVHLFDHRYASVLEEDSEAVADGDDLDATIGEPTRRATRSRNVHRPFSSGVATPEQHEDPAFTPQPRHWVAQADLVERWPENLEWAVGFRDITSPTNVRTMIACVVPYAAFGNVLPLLLPEQPDKPKGKPNPAAMEAWRTACRALVARYKESAALLVANLGALVFDYVARNKVQSVHLNSYVVEQLPMVPRTGFARRFGQRSAEEIVRGEVLALSYTSHALAPFARDQGCAGAPFAWDEEDRLRRRARLDAVFMLLYGLDQADARHVLDSFPIVRREQEARYGGRYRTRDLVLRTMAAMEAGNPDARIAG